MPTPVRRASTHDSTRLAVCQVRSLDEIYSRLNKQNTDVSRSAMAAMLEASPTALRITHRLITEGSVKTLAECLRMEYRVNAVRSRCCRGRRGGGGAVAWA